MSRSAIWRASVSNASTRRCAGPKAASWASLHGPSLQPCSTRGLAGNAPGDINEVLPRDHEIGRVDEDGDPILMDAVHTVHDGALKPHEDGKEAAIRIFAKHRRL